MVSSNVAQWAEETFGQADLGDPRRNARLIRITTAMASSPGSSLPEALQSETSQVNAAYRFLRNPQFTARQLLEPCIAATHRAMRKAPANKTFLAISDTTSLYFGHSSVQDELGPIAGTLRERGFLVHTSILLDADSGQVLGLLEKHLWTRSLETFGDGSKSKTRRYEDKESYKWEQQDERIAERIGESLMQRTITVADREADIFEYLQYKLDRGHPFIVRNNQNRALSETEDEDKAGLKVRQHLSAQPIRAEALVSIQQRGGRPAREVEVEIRTARVSLRAPFRHKEHRSIRDQEVNGVLISESQCDSDDGLCWALFTDQPIETEEDLKRLMRYYGLRWRCEEYHRAWKTNVAVETWRLQAAEHLKRAIYMTAAVAMRVLQLQKYQGDEESSCVELLSDLEWQLLWMRFETEPLPEEPPSTDWAYRSVAKLGGWYDSKRTGRAGARALKRGLERLADLVEGYSLSQSLKDTRASPGKTSG